MFKFFEKWKSFKDSIIKENKIYDVLCLIKKYNNVKIDKPIRVRNSNCYLIKNNDNLYLTVKKSDWKNYIGVHKSFYEDWRIIYCTIDNDLKFEFKIKEDIPKEIIEQLYDELIDNFYFIKEELELKIREEYYKGVR